MSGLQLSKVGVLVLALLLTLAAFVPAGVYLQWFLPGDLPCGVCIYSSIGVLILVAAGMVWHKAGAAARMRWLLQVGALCLLVVFALWTTVTCVPPVGRRVGPWAELRRILVIKSQEVAAARAALSIPADRSLTLEEMREIERLVFEPVPAYTFPIIQRTVYVRMMSSVPPYVGADFVDGRRVVFDLATMVIIYAD